MNVDPRFGRRQLLALCSAALLSPALRLYPSASAALAGKGAWLCAPAALPPMLLYLWFLSRFLTARREGEGLAELTLRALGEKAGKAALGLFGLWFLLYAGFLLRAAAERFLVAMFPHSSPAPFVVSLGAVCLLAALGSPRSLARTAKMLLPVLLGILLAMLLAALRSVEKVNLFPLTADDALPVLCGALPVANVLVFGLYSAAFLLSDTTRQPGALAAFSGWLSAMTLLLTALCAAVLGNFGAALCTRLAMPFFTLTRNLVFFRTLERMEALVVSLWIFPDFLLCSLSLTVSQRCLRLALGASAAYRGERLLALGEKRWIIWLDGAAAVALGLLLAPDAARLTLWSERLVPAANLFMAFAAIPAVLLIGRAKKRL